MPPDDDATATAASRVIATALAPAVVAVTATPAPDTTATTAALATQLAAAIAQTLTAQPTPGHTPTPTPNSAATVAALETQVADLMAPQSLPLIITAVATPTPAPISAARTLATVAPPVRAFHTLSLKGVANASTEEGYVNPPLGQVELDGVLFDMPAGRNSVTTQAEPLPDFPTRIVLANLDFVAPEAVYLLITGGNTRTRFASARIGAVTLYFAGGATHTTELIAGWNLREWKIYGDRDITTIQAPTVEQVWTSSNHFDSGEGVIDLLTIELPLEYQSSVLEAIEVRDESVNTVGSMDPAINLLGVTVRAQ